MKKSYWLDRALVVCPYYYRLCINKEDFYAELKRLKYDAEDYPKYLNNGCNATTHYFESKEYGLIAIVNIDNRKGRTTEQLCALLTHEAVHIWQLTKEHIGEDKPSVEFEAYAIQSIYQRLMESYFDQIKDKRRKK